jgi:hypothetical protein
MTIEIILLSPLLIKHAIERKMTERKQNTQTVYTINDEANE